MLTIGEFKAWITVDGVELSQHNVQLPHDGKEVTCWIASEAGKEFKVHWKDTSPYRPFATTGAVELDGVQCGGRIIYRSDESSGHNRGSRSEQCKDAVATSSKTRRPFRFSTLNLTDDDNCLTDANSVSNIGQIVLRIRRVEVICKSTVIPSRKGPIRLPGESKVHERAKKASVHAIQLGEEYESYSARVFSRDLDDKPRVVFVFKYAPLDVLRANGVVLSETGQIQQPAAPSISNYPATAAPGGSERRKVKREERDRDEEIMVLERQLKRLKNEKAEDARPSANSTPGPNTPKRIKREFAFTLGEVIDLT